jgi:hypothetical protein
MDRFSGIGDVVFFPNAPHAGPEEQLPVGHKTPVASVAFTSTYQDSGDCVFRIHYSLCSAEPRSVVLEHPSQKIPPLINLGTSDGSCIDAWRENIYRILLIDKPASTCNCQRIR